MATARKVNVQLSDDLREPTDFGEVDYPGALVNVTNICNLSCTHCFVFRADNPNKPQDKMNDATMLHQLEVLRDKHHIKSMLFMGGEPMILKELVMKAMPLFERSSIVTNGTYGIPSVPGHLVTVSLDGPEELSDEIRGQGVYQKVKKAVFERDANDGTTVMIQMTITKQNAPGIEEFVETVKDWPISGVAFTFYVPTMHDESNLAWQDLRERDDVVRRVMAVKAKHPKVVKTNVGALELMLSENSMAVTGEHGETCGLKNNMLPLYMGEGGEFERTYCCYGNDVDCTKCGAYGVFNGAYHRMRGTAEDGE